MPNEEHEYSFVSVVSVDSLLSGVITVNILFYVVDAVIKYNKYI